MRKRVATIGFFDGVHLGHQYLCQQLKQLAGDQGKTIAITFKDHPQRVLGRADAPNLLTTTTEKSYFLENICGIDQVEFLDFDRAMANLSAEEFMDRYLHDTFGITHLLVGYDHHFGRPRWGEGFEQYVEFGKELDIEVVCAKEYPDMKVSSSRIRKHFLAGNMEEGNRLLGYTYCVHGTVVEGEKEGRKMGFPTVNLQLSDSLKMLPQGGVYVTTAHVAGRDFPAVTNIGTCPTVRDNGDITIESHILANALPELYGEAISLYIHSRLRDEQQFETTDALKSQIANDVEAAIAYHREHPHLL